MPKQNHFKGATLAEAIRNATADYRKETAPEAKSYCSDLRSEFDRKKIGFDHIHDRIVDMQREVGRLEDQARDARNAALLSALVALGGALGSAARGLNKLRKLRLGKFTRKDLLDWVPVVGGAALSGSQCFECKIRFQRGP